MTLTGSARIADPTGSATADQIVMNQKTGDFDADGHVTSTRLPEKKGPPSSAMLNNDEPMQAKANHMTSRESNLLIHYEGKAVAWQGANRVEADKLDIDRDDSIMKAEGQVISQFVDKPKKDKEGKLLPNQTTIFTVVRAQQMTYHEEDRTAVYTGGVVLNRPNLNVKSQELKAFLKDKDADSSLDKAFADGAVNIVQTMPGRTRVGASDHGEYYTGEEKIILEKGNPKFVDSLRGTTEGERLTYFTNDERLLVNGAEKQRAESTIHRKPKSAKPKTP
jgi:lipopolysaccharide export system protein LptA